MHLRPTALPTHFEHSPTHQHAVLPCRLQVYLQAAMQGAGQQPLLKAPLMDAAEQQLVLQGFNDTDLEYNSQTFVHGQFMQRARETPSAPCVIFEDYAFSYAEVRGAMCTPTHLNYICANSPFLISQLVWCCHHHTSSNFAVSTRAKADSRQCCSQTGTPRLLLSRCRRSMQPPTASPTT